MLALLKIEPGIKIKRHLMSKRTRFPVEESYRNSYDLHMIIYKHSNSHYWNGNVAQKWIRQSKTYQVLKNLIPSNKVSLAVKFNNNSFGFILGQGKKPFSSSSRRLFQGQHLSSFSQFCLCCFCTSNITYKPMKPKAKESFRNYQDVLPISQLQSIRAALTSLIGALVGFHTKSSQQTKSRIKNRIGIGSVGNWTSILNTFTNKDPTGCATGKSTSSFVHRSKQAENWKSLVCIIVCWINQSSTIFIRLPVLWNGLVWFPLRSLEHSYSIQSLNLSVTNLLFTFFVVAHW